MTRHADGYLIPDFIIIGAMKSGTTTLYRYLADHPDVGMSRDKETDFFVAEKAYGRGFAWYGAQFDPARPVHGEASPNYTKRDVFPGVAARIHQRCPNARLIYVLRDPVERAVSQYRHTWAMGRIDAAPADMADTAEYRHILAASRYAEQLEDYLRLFPQEQILVLDFADLVADAASAMDRVHSHLGLTPHPPPRQAAHNAGTELSRVPPSLLRLAQSPLGRSLNRVMSRDLRDSVRRVMASGTPRDPAPFPPDLLARMRGDLRDDAQRLRALTGQRFETWSV